MPIKRKCSDKHGYGCTNEYETETVEEMKKYFKLNKLANGLYFRTVCKKCEARKHREEYHKGNKSYLGGLRKLIDNFYGESDYGVAFA